MIVLASTESEQKAFVDSAGLPLMIKDDLAEDFHDLLKREVHSQEARYSVEQLEIISFIDDLLGQKSGEIDPDFWVFGTLSCTSGWEEIRIMAKRYLELGGTGISVAKRDA